LWGRGPAIPDLDTSAVTLRSEGYMQGTLKVNPHFDGLQPFCPGTWGVHRRGLIKIRV